MFNRILIVIFFGNKFVLYSKYMYMYIVYHIFLSRIRSLSLSPLGLLEEISNKINFVELRFLEWSQLKWFIIFVIVCE